MAGWKGVDAEDAEEKQERTRRNAKIRKSTQARLDFLRSVVVIAI
jgi:hypothetical protein